MSKPDPKPPTECFLCSANAGVVPDKGSTQVDCAACGLYIQIGDFGKDQDIPSWLISAYVRREFRRLNDWKAGGKPVTMDSLFFGAQDWKIRPSTGEQVIYALRELENARKAGRGFLSTHSDWPLLFVRGPDECEAILRYLVEERHAEKVTSAAFCITVRGRLHLETLERSLRDF